jgi:hypothetical protein
MYSYVYHLVTITFQAFQHKYHLHFQASSIRALERMRERERTGGIPDDVLKVKGTPLRFLT